MAEDWDESPERLLALLRELSVGIIINAQDDEPDKVVGMDPESLGTNIMVGIARAILGDRRVEKNEAVQIDLSVNMGDKKLYHIPVRIAVCHDDEIEEIKQMNEPYHITHDEDEGKVH